MFVSHIKVRNFRCFENAQFDFSPGFNLFVGENGAGKTSLLKAVTAVLANVVNGISPTSDWPHKHDENAREALLVLQGKVRYEKNYPVRLEAQGEIFDIRHDWQVEKTSATDSVLTKFSTDILNILKGRADEIAVGSDAVLPIAVFYSADRSWRSRNITATAAVKEKESRFDAYRDWSKAGADATLMETWVIAKSLERLEAVGLSIEGGGQCGDDELALASAAVSAAIPGAKGLRYDIRARRMVLDWDGKDPVTFDALSDGQRAVVALVTDIARRMALLNPQTGRDVLTETPGIVLVDELDMHLHPAWQRRLPTVLKTVFPKVQFLVTAHSPQMMGELRHDEIWLMSHGQVEGHPSRSFGLSSNEVLEELMDTPVRNEAFDHLLAQAYLALDEENLDEARHILAQLRESAEEDTPAMLEIQVSIDSLSQWKDGDES